MQPVQQRNLVNLQLLNNCCHRRDNMSCGVPERHSLESHLNIEISLLLI